MNGIFSLMVLLAIAVSISLAFRCPDSLGIYRDYDYNSYHRPSHYYICVNFVPFRQPCPEQMIFDERYKQCKLDTTYVIRPQYGTTLWGWNSNTERPWSIPGYWWGSTGRPWNTPEYSGSTRRPSNNWSPSRPWVDTSRSPTTAAPWYWHQDGPTSGYWSHDKPNTGKPQTRSHYQFIKK